MRIVIVGAALGLACSTGLAQTVKITPLGSHPGELSHVIQSATEGGKLRPGSRTAALIKELKGPTPHLAIGGRTMEFDGKGRCVTGC